MNTCLSCQSEIPDEDYHCDRCLESMIDELAEEGHLKTT